MKLDVVLALSLDEDFGLSLINIDKPWLMLINLKLGHGVDSEVQRSGTHRFPHHWSSTFPYDSYPTPLTRAPREGQGPSTVYEWKMLLTCIIKMLSFKGPWQTFLPFISDIYETKHEGGLCLISDLGRSRQMVNCPTSSFSKTTRVENYLSELASLIEAHLNTKPNSFQWIDGKF